MHHAKIKLLQSFAHSLKRVFIELTKEELLLYFSNIMLPWKRDIGDLLSKFVSKNISKHFPKDEFIRRRIESTMYKNIYNFVLIK